MFRKGGQQMVASLVTEGFDLGSVPKGTILVVFIEVFELLAGAAKVRASGL